MQDIFAHNDYTEPRTHLGLNDLVSFECERLPGRTIIYTKIIVIISLPEAFS